MHNCNGTGHAGAVVVTLHAVAAADDAALGLTVDIGKFLDFTALKSRHLHNVIPGNGVDAGDRLIGTDTAGIEKLPVDHLFVRKQILHHAYCDPGVGCGLGLQINIGLRADRRTVGVHGQNLRPPVAGHVDEFDAVHVGYGFVKAPGDVAVAVGDLFRVGAVSCALNTAETPDTGFRADHTVKVGSADAVEETVSCAHTDGAVVAGVRVREDRFRTVLIDHFVRLFDEFVPGFFPGDAAPLVRTLFADSFHRVKNAVRCVRVLHIGQPLHARAGPGLKLLFGTAHVGHAAVLHTELHQTAVGAVTQAAVVLDHAGAFVEQNGVCTVRVHSGCRTRHQSSQTSRQGRCSESLKEVSAFDSRHTFLLNVF